MKRKKKKSLGNTARVRSGVRTASMGIRSEAQWMAWAMETSSRDCLRCIPNGQGGTGIVRPKENKSMDLCSADDICEFSFLPRPSRWFQSYTSFRHARCASIAHSSCSSSRAPKMSTDGIELHVQRMPACSIGLIRSESAMF